MKTAFEDVEKAKETRYCFLRIDNKAENQVFFLFDVVVQESDPTGTDLKKAVY